MYGAPCAQEQCKLDVAHRLTSIYKSEFFGIIIINAFANVRRLDGWIDLLWWLSVIAAQF